MNCITTGSSGFLCRNMVPTFLTEGFRIMSLNDIRNEKTDISVPFHLCFHQEYDAVIHIAGKAHVAPRSEIEKEAFWKVNFEGTKNLCHAIEETGNIPANFVFISTVSVYGVEEGRNVSEDVPLNGASPYARSKIEAEKWLAGWAEKRGVNLLILRLPLIAGSNPPGNLGAMINGIKTGRYLRIGKGNARKSAVLAEDVAHIIARSIGKVGTYNLTDGCHPSFRELEDMIAFQLGKRSPRSVPLWFAKILAKTGDLIGNKFPINTSRLEKITNTLTFSDQKARNELGWAPRRVIDEFRIS